MVKIFNKHLLSTEWEYIIPDMNQLYRITLFDDGMNIYQKYNNKWFIFGKWRGKIALLNHNDPDIIIKSISSWKVKKLI